MLSQRLLGSLLLTRYSAIGQFLFPVPSSREFIAPDGHGFFAHTHKADQLQVIYRKGKKRVICIPYFYCYMQIGIFTLPSIHNVVDAKIMGSYRVRVRCPFSVTGYDKVMS